VGDREVSASALGGQTGEADGKLRRPDRWGKHPPDDHPFFAEGIFELGCSSIDGLWGSFIFI
jgi:hypothetical protein